MKYYDLDKEEKQILADLENNQLRSVKNVSRFKKVVSLAASQTLAKTKNINLRLSQKTLGKLRAKAVTLGIPYQTLASSILHQSVEIPLNKI